MGWDQVLTPTHTSPALWEFMHERMFACFLSGSIQSSIENCDETMLVRGMKCA
jgi:hypothetical protein